MIDIPANCYGWQSGPPERPEPARDEESDGSLWFDDLGDARVPAAEERDEEEERRAL